MLVILAILAALLIPALTGYIDKAKKDQVIAETRMLHEAIQTEMVELYGSNTNWKTLHSNTSDGGCIYSTMVQQLVRNSSNNPEWSVILSNANKPL